MIGETGSGKSSFLRTFTTALMSNTDIKDNYRVGPKKSRELSVTKRVKFYVKLNIFFINILFRLEKENVLLTLQGMVNYMLNIMYFFKPDFKLCNMFIATKTNFQHSDRKYKNKRIKH